MRGGCEERGGLGKGKLGGKTNNFQLQISLLFNLFFLFFLDRKLFGCGE